MAGFSRRHRWLVRTSGAIALTMLIAMAWYIHGSPRLTIHAGNLPQDVAFSPDGSMLATQDVDRVVKVWDLTSGTPRPIPIGSTIPDWARHRNQETSAGRFCATIDVEDPAWPARNVTICDTSTQELFRRFEPHPDQVNDVALSPDGLTLATAGGFTYHPWPVNAAGDARLWDVESGRLLATLKRHWGAVSAVAFSPDGRTLATSCLDGSIRLWDVTDVTD